MPSALLVLRNILWGKVYLHRTLLSKGERSLLRILGLCVFFQVVILV